MRKLLPDFKSSDEAGWYDLREDWQLIEASIAAQYGIRIRHQADMPWNEFCTLISGLMPETPLGSIVAIRSEKDSEVIKIFTPAQRKIYRDWQLKIANRQLDNPEKLDAKMKDLEVAFNYMFGGDSGGE